MRVATKAVGMLKDQRSFSKLEFPRLGGHVVEGGGWELKEYEKSKMTPRVLAMARDVPALWEGQKAKIFLSMSRPILQTHWLNAVGKEKRGQKGKLWGRRRESFLEEGREEGFETKRLVNNVKYFREAREVKAGSNWRCCRTAATEVLWDGGQMRVVGSMLEASKWRRWVLTMPLESLPKKKREVL